MKNSRRFPVICACACALLAFAVAPLSATEGNFTFKVHNTTKLAIKKLLASEDGKTWGNFDIGKGIAPGKTVELVWDKSTDTEACTQWFKAVFADGSQSEATEFDFCEEDLELEF